jgi:hypothetical protein
MPGDAVTDRLRAQLSKSKNVALLRKRLWEKVQKCDDHLGNHETLELKDTDNCIRFSAGGFDFCIFITPLAENTSGHAQVSYALVLPVLPGEDTSYHHLCSQTIDQHGRLLTEGGSEAALGDSIDKPGFHMAMLYAVLQEAQEAVAAWSRRTTV